MFERNSFCCRNEQRQTPQQGNEADDWRKLRLLPWPLPGVVRLGPGHPHAPEAAAGAGEGRQKGLGEGRAQPACGGQGQAAHGPHRGACGGPGGLPGAMAQRRRPREGKAEARQAVLHSCRSSCHAVAVDDHGNRDAVRSRRRKENVPVFSSTGSQKENL